MSEPTSRVNPGRVNGEGGAGGEDRVGAALLPPLEGGLRVAAGGRATHQRHAATLQNVRLLGRDEGRS